MLKFPSAVALLVLLAQPASADCAVDVRLHNSIADQYNQLSGSPACDSGAQKAVILGLLEEIRAVSVRLESCEGVTGGTSVSELTSMIASFDQNTKDTCRQLQTFNQIDQDLKNFRSALEAELEEGKAKLREMEEQAEKLNKQIQELENKEKAEKQAAAANAKPARKFSKEKCEKAVAYMKTLAAGGNDVSKLKDQLSGFGCDTN